MKFLFALLFIPLLTLPAFAQSNSQTLPTSDGTLDVRLSYDDISLGDETRLLVEFINPQTEKIQEHIDYRVLVTKGGDNIFGPIPLTHTSEGVVRGLTVEFPEEGNYSIDFDVEGILFQPIPKETVSFDIAVGEAQAQPDESTTPINGADNGGCLIATATFGSEIAPQVQQLRELRDNTVLKTNSGTVFMTAFNQFYYSFSPTVADLERQNPIFKEVMKLTLQPMLATLSILSYVDIDSEQEMLGYGVSMILLNIAMYVGIPMFGILRLYQFRRK